ncbi:MAG TPA: YgdI/YgdR family lipoprotein [Verrucomicrobiae bacterium]|jgi:hypothetical protein|nr:YgdI/YgdR family lipoprotein [Verrucomicrobiae bacterium]
MNIEKNTSLANSRFAQSLHRGKLAKLLLLFLSTSLLAGCAHRYDIMLTNGERVTNVTKPVLDREHGVFAYKDVTGREHHLFAGKVVDIGPHSNKNTTPGTLKE